MSVDTNKNMDKNWVESEIATCSKGSSSSEKDNKKEKEQKSRGTIIMVLVALLAILLILLTLINLPEQYMNFKDTVIWQMTYTELPDDGDETFSSNQIDVNIQYIEDNAFSVSYRDTFAGADGKSKGIYRFGVVDGATMYHIMQEANKIDVTNYIDRHDSTGGQTSFRIWNQDFDGTSKYNFMVYDGTTDETRAEIMDFMEYIEKVDKKVGTFVESR